MQILLKTEGVDISLKDSEERAILHWLAGVSERKPSDKDKIDYCLKLLLSSNYVQMKGIDDRYTSGNTALSIAVERGFQYRVMVLLNNGADVMALEQGSKALLSSMSSVLEEILDNCLMSNDKPVTSKDYSLEFGNPQLLGNLSLCMAESQHLRDLLKHPVISTFLTLKWEKFRWLFYLDLAFYVTFVFFLTVYILCSESYKTLTDAGVARNTTGPFSFNDSYITSGINDKKFTSQTNKSSLQVLGYSLTVLLVILFSRKVAQLAKYRWAYILSLENWLEILLLIATLLSYTDV